MSWIRTVPAEAARGELAVLYRKAVDPESGKLDNIMRVHSLHPHGLAAHLTLYSAVMKGTPGLRKTDRELIALAVSMTNECEY